LNSKWQFNLSKPVAGERSAGVIRVEVAETGDKSGVLFVVDESEEIGCVGEGTGEFKLRRRNICSARYVKRRLQHIISHAAPKWTYSILMKRDAIFSTIADGTNTSGAGVDRKTHRAEDVLVRAQVDSEWIDGEPGVADISIGEADGREIQ